MNHGVQATFGAAQRAEAPPTISPWCNSAGKRTFDLVVTAAALVPALPLMLVAALAVKLGSRGPVLFRQKRCGRGGSEFEVLKFRTMQHGASGFGVTRQGDRRITRVGALLRRWKLDELPQLLNVIRGDMSLVGPRPDLPEYINTLSAQEREVLMLRPGLTGYATLRFRHEEQTLAAAPAERMTEFYVNTILPAKVALDLEYASRATLLSDISLLLQTAAAILR